MPRRVARATNRAAPTPPTVGAPVPAVAPDGLVPVTFTIPLDQLPAEGALPDGMDAATAERLHPPVAPPSEAPALTPAEQAEQARWQRRRDKAHAQVERHLARYEQHRLPLNYPGAVEFAREMLVMALSMEHRPCPHCGGALGARLPRLEAETRELEAQVALLDQHFAEALHRREQEHLAARPAAAARVRGQGGSGRGNAGGRGGNAGGAPSLFSRRPPPRMLRPSAPDAPRDATPQPGAALADAIARHA